MSEIVNVKEVVKFFGGKEQIVADYSKLLKKDITVKAVEKWIERNSLPGQHHTNLISLASKKKLSFNLADFFEKGKK